MILVVGATGVLGSAVCNELRAARKPFRALVRTGSTREHDLRDQGAEIVFGDLKDRASLAAACRGIRTVISTASSTLSRRQGDSIESVDRMGQIELVDAARSAGVQQFIFVSFNHDRKLDCALSRAKAEVEQLLIHSGMQFTILRAGFFMEVWLSPGLGFDIQNAKATVYGSGNEAVSWVSAGDVARVVVACVDNPAAVNRDIGVASRDAFSPRQVVRIYEEESGRKFQIDEIPVAALEAQRSAAEDPLQHSFATLMLMVACGHHIDTAEMAKLIPPPLTSVREYARRFLSAAHT